MNKLIHIGFGNIVNTSKIIAIVSPDSAPIKRLVQKAREEGTAIDATQGRKTKAVLVMENSQVVLSALLPETIAGRAQGTFQGGFQNSAEESSQDVAAGAVQGRGQGVSRNSAEESSQDVAVGAVQGRGQGVSRSSAEESVPGDVFDAVRRTPQSGAQGEVPRASRRREEAEDA